MAEERRGGVRVCWLCGPTVHIKSCDNCRGKHSWWKAISQIILATIRECGGVKWRFHVQMRRWERATPPNGSLTLALQLFGLLRMGRGATKKPPQTPGEGAKSAGLSPASIMR